MMLAATTILACGVAAAADSLVPLPTAVQSQWMDSELGGLITWGMNNPCTPQFCPKGTQWLTTGVSMCSGCHWEMKALPPVSDFDPVDLNVTAWVEAAASFGAKYLVISANHAGGFALWPTKAVVPRHGRYNYSVAFSRGNWTQKHDIDIVAQFVAACRKANISPGFYLNVGQNMYLNFGADSKSHSVDPTGRFSSCSMNPAYGPLKPGQINITRTEYYGVAMEMMAELFTQYGAISEVWFDGGVPLELADQISDLLDSLQPTAVSFQGPNRHEYGFSGNVVRWSGLETGHTPAKDMWSTIIKGAQGSQAMAYGAGTKPDNTSMEASLEFVPAEQDGAIQGVKNAGGFWYPGETPKTVSELLAEYEDSVGHNSNYLLELSPDPQGRIPVPDVTTYAAFGAALTKCYLGPGAAKRELMGPVGGSFFDLEGATEAVDRILLAEDVAACGQRVTGFELLAAMAPAAAASGSGSSSPDALKWTSIGGGQSIGHCSIHRLKSPLPAGTQIRLNVTAWVGGNQERMNVDGVAAACSGSPVQLRRMASFSMQGCTAPGPGPASLLGSIYV